MPTDDVELERFRRAVDCAALLENWSSPWRLDRRESTRRALKYRRAEGEILIVNHDGRGWWDPQSEAKGDIFSLVQYLEPDMKFPQMCDRLRRLVRVAPRFPAELRVRRKAKPAVPIAQRWEQRCRLRRGPGVWNYLAEARRLPPGILEAADAADVLREGYKDSAWFAHRHDGAVTHVEVRGPDFKGSLRGGRKTLFRFPSDRTTRTRLVITEAPIDTLSVAAIEGLRTDTLYAATGGGMGPDTIAVLRLLLGEMAQSSSALLASATDANKAGERYAERHAQLAAAAGIAFERYAPPAGSDWNDVLMQRSRM
jgi:hypothetical protein